MKNKKGIVNLFILAATHSFAVGVMLAYQIGWGVVLAPAVWHIPAWTQAKHDHTEEIYQAQQMWPQQVFNKIPTTEISYRYGNGGNFAKGMQD